MAQLPPSAMAAFMRAAPSLGPAGEFLARIFAPFSFDETPEALPTTTFEGRLELSVGDATCALKPAEIRGIFAELVSGG